MNKKIFATALLAIAAFVSTGATAAVTFGDSTDAINASGQDANAIVSQGGTARANDIVLGIGNGGTSGDLPKDGEIIVRLPTGLNFDGAPFFKVTAKTTGAGLALKDNTSFADPTLGDAYGASEPTVGVTLYDTDGDGGMDRAVAVAAAFAATQDTLTISVNVKANSDAKTGLKKATVSVSGAASTADIVTVTDQALTSGVNSSPDTDLTVKSQILTDNRDIGVLTSEIFVVIPKGTKNGKTITFTPNGNVQWRPTTSTITLTSYTPFGATSGIAPLTGTTVVNYSDAAVAFPTAGSGLTATVSLKVQNAPTAGLANDAIVKMVVNVATLSGTTTAKVGKQGLTVAGTAGLTGKVNLFDVSANGSSAALAKGAKVVSIVKGSAKTQTLPSITITEIFDGDWYDSGTTPTVTLTAGAGLKFSTDTSAITISDAGGTVNLAFGQTTPTASVMTLKFTGDGAGTKTLTISGLKATATATGDLSLTVGGATIDSQFGPKGDKITVASGVEAGTVTVKGPAKLTKIGANKTTGTAVFTITESTYGSISIAKKSATTNAYFSVVPNNGAKISGVSTNVTGTGLVIGTCAVESTGSATWVCPVTSESSALLPGTDVVKVTVTLSGEKSVVGDTISVEVGGNVGASGTADVAQVSETSTTKVTGGITQVKEGLTEIQKVSGFVISQTYDASLNNGVFRLLAPQGVAFAGTAPSPIGGGTATALISTFNPNDTYEISSTGRGNTGTITVTNLNVLVSGGVSGDIVFELIDGNASGKFATGLVPESLTLAYADKTLVALTGGKDVSLNVDYSTTQEIKGGLVGDGYTVKSSSTPTVSVSVSGSTMTIKGVAAGAANITVTDSLGTVRCCSSNGRGRCSNTCSS